MGGGHFLDSDPPGGARLLPSLCCIEAARKVSYLRDYCIVLEVVWRKIKHKPIILSNGGVCAGRCERILVENKKL